MSWTTVEELHLVLHRNKSPCDWLRGYTEQAAVGFGSHAEAVKR
ncbi:hypothetical protein [Kitasatospora sp. HPMI-4]